MRDKAREERFPHLAHVESWTHGKCAHQSAGTLERKPPRPTCTAADAQENPRRELLEGRRRAGQGLPPRGGGDRRGRGEAVWAVALGTTRGFCVGREERASARASCGCGGGYCGGTLGGGEWEDDTGKLTGWGSGPETGLYLPSPATGPGPLQQQQRRLVTARPWTGGVRARGGFGGGAREKAGGRVGFASSPSDRGASRWRPPRSARARCASHPDRHSPRLQDTLPSAHRMAAARHVTDRGLLHWNLFTYRYRHHHITDEPEDVLILCSYSMYRYPFRSGVGSFGAEPCAASLTAQFAR